MNLKKLSSLLEAKGCQKIYIKNLAPNDNSKNQVYFGGGFEILNILPISAIQSEPAGDWRRERFKAAINFSWLGENGEIFNAPFSQLILYPKYPEVRFSGFLKNCADAPSELMTIRLANRLLFFGVADGGNVLGYVAHPNSEIANEVNQLRNFDQYGVFKVVSSPKNVNNKEKLISELKRIHELGWITSKRLDKNKNILPCPSPNCGGYTLEAELDISPNGYSEPDFLGWEIKQFNVINFQKINSAIITLMTPEPTGGYYVDEGVEAFIRKYGYVDNAGRADRQNFGGIHKAGLIHPKTNLNIELIGFDSESGKIRNTDGRIALVDKNNNEAASWSFASMLIHWNRKHNLACYVPSLSETGPERKYKYGNKILMGTGTDFQLFLKDMDEGKIYYDPGIKMENASSKPKIKRRSQFRIKSEFLKTLYKSCELIDVTQR